MRAHAKLALLLPLAAGLILVSPRASARPTDDLLHDINVTGTTTDVVSQARSTFTGTLEATGLLIGPDGSLVVQGVLTGLASGDGVSTSIVGQIFSTSATLTGQDDGRCELLNLDLAPLSLNLLSLQVDLEEVDLNIAGEHGPGKLLGSLLCSLTHLVDNPDMTEKARRIVGRIDTLLGGLLTNVPVMAPVDEGTSFTGFLTVSSIAVGTSGSLVVNGVLNGVIAGDGVTTPVINQAVAVTAELTGGSRGKCDVLTLDAGSVNLGSLGLNVDLAPVALDIRSLQGTGNLLGNLLCRLSASLDRGSPGREVPALVRKINSLLD